MNTRLISKDDKLFFQNKNLAIYFNDRNDFCYAKGYSGKSIKHAFHYRFKNDYERSIYATKWIETQTKKLLARDEYKQKNKDNRKLRAIEQTEKIKNDLKVGCFLKNIWGCTMQGVRWYEVVSFDGKRIGLAIANNDFRGRDSQAGIETLSGASDDKTIKKYAVIRNGYIVYENKSLSDSWSTLTFCKIGDEVSVYGD